MTQKPQLTLVIGLPGVGKSTVARIIAETIHAVILNTDVIRRELFPDARTYSLEETLTVIAEMQKLAERHLREGKGVIIDSLLAEQSARNYYIVLAKKLHVACKIILVTANEHVIKKRIDERLVEKSDPSEANFLTYLKFKARFEPILGQYIVIDNSADIDTLREKLEMLQ